MASTSEGLRAGDRATRWLRRAAIGATAAAVLAIASCSGAPATMPGATTGATPNGLSSSPELSGSATSGATASGTPGATLTATPAPLPTATPTRTPSPAPTPAPSPAPPIAAGSQAWVAVTVATGWHTAGSPRPVDAPALENPTRIRDWLAALTESQQAALIGLMDTQMLLGERVMVVSVAGGWAHVVVPDQPSPLDSRGYPVWMPLAQLTAVALPFTDSEATVVAPTAWLRSDSGGQIAEVSFATRLPVLGSDATRVEVALPGGATAWLDASAVSVKGAAVNALPQTGDSVVDSARAFIGLRYLWSGTSGFGFDCSGLVHIVYRAHGVLLPRDADAQALVGSAVAQSALQPGDLVFFAQGGAVHHVAIYAGGGQIIDSPDIAKPIRIVALSAVSSGEQLTFRRVLP